MDKFIPEFSKDFFDKQFAALPGADKRAGEKKVLDRVIFDPEFMAKRVNQADGQDLILTSACNMYEGVTQQEVEDFYNNLKDTTDLTPISWGLNCKVVKRNGKIVEGAMETPNDDEDKRSWRATEYGIGWLPLGGYCAISGMIDESMNTEAMKQPAKPYEFRSKPAWQRLLIMLGGVLFNFLLAIIIYAGIAYAVGGALATLDFGTAQKHIAGRGDSRCFPIAVSEDGDKVAAGPEHIIHILHVGRVEAAQVKTGQTAAALEHLAHP